MSVPFLLEIGAEEIPDWMIPPALVHLQQLFEKLGIPHSSVRTDATPRRLVLRAEGLPERQADRAEKVQGPAKSAPAQAVAGFVRKQGIAPADLQVETTAKGEYYTYLKQIPGRAVKDILAEALAGLVLGIYFPKTMYWRDKNQRFIRPIRWMVALLGDEIVPFEVAGMRSGGLSSGHRRLGSPEIAVTCADFEQRLRDHHVILSADERRDKIRTELAGVRVKRDDELLEVLVYITEYPTAITGAFDAEFLALPEEVLVTVMRHHQKNFSVEDAEGKLSNQFVAVMNIDADREGFVRRGNERVLRARFNDARFFWDTDQKKKLADRLDDLKLVTFQKDVGSYFAKVERMVAMARELGGDEQAVRAVRLSKCDLTTELVKEFTELQGVVGGLYARVQGEPDAVWQAVYDHYQPASMEGAIPLQRTGQIVSLADKLDTLRECFRAELYPTGSKDPYALRRAAQGVVKILVEGGISVQLRPLLGGDAKLEEFMVDRIRYYFKDIRGFAYDEINAVLASGWDDLVDVAARLERVQRLRQSPDFEPLAASFKRIKNILRQAEFSGAGAVDERTLEAGPEQELYAEFRRLAGQPLEGAISRLRPKVDSFFDKVLVNSPDATIRLNRLTLLNTLLSEFSTIADFSEIVTNS